MAIKDIILLKDIWTRSESAHCHNTLLGSILPVAHGRDPRRHHTSSTHFSRNRPDGLVRARWCGSFRRERQRSSSLR